MAAMQGTREFAALLEVSRQQKWLGNAD
jgi:hypothetical protein